MGTFYLIEKDRRVGIIESFGPQFPVCTDFILKNNDLLLQCSEAIEYKNSDRYYHELKILLNTNEYSTLINKVIRVPQMYIYGWNFDGKKEKLLPMKIITNIEIKLPFKLLPSLLQEKYLDQEIIRWRLEKGV